MNLSDYKGKKVLVTGVTGFKGSWLAMWLVKLGATVVGVANGIPTSPSLFKTIKIENKIDYTELDIRDFQSINNLVKKVQPDYVFHLAAQAIVSESKKNPIYTIETNTVGTANVLNSLRSLDNNCIAVMITSDKCYENKEWIWGYRETDALGGKDIYSASKASAEIIISAFVRTYFTLGDKKNIRIATARAGNVIGGGDWSADRIVVDCVTKWSKNEKVNIRSPMSTRPWQHVLEPLGGYLTLGIKLKNDYDLHGESFNFGPKLEKPIEVIELIKKLSSLWKVDDRYAEFGISQNCEFNEAGLLQLNCEKSRHYLKWEANMKFSETIEMVGDWYKNFYFYDENSEDLTLKQISTYERICSERIQK
jgi:CDP-glucose 4,6-dehydratase